MTALYGSLDRFKELAAHQGWFKLDTINRWFRGERVPDAPTLTRLKQVTGISVDWLITGVGLPRDMPGQLYLDALEAEGRQPQPVSVPAHVGQGAGNDPSVPDYSGQLLSPDLDRTRYRVIACRFCDEAFRQFLEDPTNPDDWSPVCCFKCREERLEIPNRQADILRDRLPQTQQELERRRQELAEAQRRGDPDEVKRVQESVKRAMERVERLRSPVASVMVTPSTATLSVGQTVQLTATTKDANGNVLTGRVVTWASGTTAVATVSSTGLVTGVGAGSATITATSEIPNGTATVTVKPVPVASVMVAPSTATLSVGQTALATGPTCGASREVLSPFPKWGPRFLLLPPPEAGGRGLGRGRDGASELVGRSTQHPEV